jgi:hypothetical protein
MLLLLLSMLLTQSILQERGGRAFSVRNVGLLQA